MGLTVNANLGLDKVLKRGKSMLGTGGHIQQFIDSTVLAGVAPYVPMRGSGLGKSATLHTQIGGGKQRTRLHESAEKHNRDNPGSGKIIWKGPQARLLYYGVVYVDPVYKAAGFPIRGNGGEVERWVSRKGVRKVPSSPERLFNFDQSRHPKAGRLWCERYKQDHLKELAAAAQKEVDAAWNS